MAMTRREWLKANATVAAALSIPVVSACGDDDGGGDGLPNYSYDGPEGPANTFEHGVATGDPLADAIIFWTRVTGADAPVEVWLDVAPTADFEQRVVAQGFMVDDSTDYTLKVDITDLEPGTTYYYRFFALGVQSPIGRTKTMPMGPASDFRAAVVTCSNWGFGYFHAYRHVAARADLDCVLHLGDYIYEYRQGAFPFENETIRRTIPEHEIITLDDYRLRYKTYRTDPDLKEAHRQHPWIVVWDDHEIANNTFDGGAEEHNPATEGPFADRLANAKQAFFEYIPIRGVPADSIRRSFSFGDLVDIVMVDTRVEGRSEQISDAADDSDSRTMMGADQEAWFATEMSGSTAQWRLIGNQVVVAHFTYDGVESANLDGWDGYAAARSRLYDAFASSPGNVVVVTGDLHGSVCYDLPRDPFSADYDSATGSGSLGTEFVTPPVTAPYFAIGEVTTQDTDLVANSPHSPWAEFRSKGYLVLHANTDRVHVDYYFLDGVLEGEGNQSFATGFDVADGTNHVVENATEAPQGDGELAP